MKKLSFVLIAVALIISHIMCCVVAFNYSQLLCGIAHQGFSAPAETAFITAVPFLAGMALCLFLAYMFSKRR